MKSVADMEAKGGTDFMLRIRNQVKKVRLHIIVAFFIGNAGNSGDMLCAGCFGGYTSVGCISRVCDCPQARCSNTETECVFLLRQKMEETYHISLSSDVDIAKQATTDLQTLSQHSIELATNLLSIGGDKYGIFSAHLVELMHCFLGGIAKYAICAY